jgi:CubicO group peptidase (beta-lactamase class C family)
MFRIASISKSFTAVTFMWLTEHYASSLPKGIYTPVFGPGALLGTTYGTNKNYGARIRNITVQHLLEHTAGWNASNAEIDVTGSPLAIRTHGEMITHVLDAVPPIRDPGAGFDYLNFGYLVLGVIIEQVTKQSYESFVQNSIMKASQITKMRVALDNKPLPGEVNYYPGSLPAISKFDAFGGWVATAIDLTRLLVKVDQIGTDDILNNTNLNLMYQPGARNPGYAKGWIIKPSYKGNNGILEPGTRSFFAQMNKGGFSFAAIGNSNDAKSADLGSFALESLMEEICNGASWPDYDLYGVTVAAPWEVT